MNHQEVIEDSKYDGTQSVLPVGREDMEVRVVDSSQEVVGNDT